MQSHAHEYDEHHRHPHTNFGSQQVAHGVEEHHDDQHEKKSVLKKVKAKAKKIKDTITKHGHHDHEHEHGHHEDHYGDQHIPDDHDLDEEDDEDEEMVEDPEIHGAPIYDSAAVRNVTPGQAKTSGPGVKFGGATVMGEEPHHEPRVVVVSPTTEIHQSRFIDPAARTFVREERAGVEPKVNLERPMNLEEDPHAPRRRPEAYAPANYQTKVTDPTGAGGAEIDITPVQKSLARMTVPNEPKPNPGTKILPTVSGAQYSPIGISHHQFEPELSTATKTHYPSTRTHDQNLPALSSEIKTQYPKTQHPSAYGHDQNLPQLSSSATKTPYPSTGSHDQFMPELLPIEPKPHLPQYSSAIETQYPSAGSHGQNLSELSTSATKTPYPSTRSHDLFIQELPNEPKPQYPSATSHDQFFPQHSSAIKTQHPSAGSHDQFLPNEPKPQQYPSAISHDQYLPQHSSGINTQYPSAGSHYQFISELPNEPKPQQYTSATSHDQYFPQHSSAIKTQYPSAGSHDHFIPKLQTEPKPQHYTSATSHDQYLPQYSSAINPSVGSNDQFTPEFSTQTKSRQTVEEHPQSNSYTDNITSTASAIADKAKNAVASTLGYGRENETSVGEKPPNQNQSTYTEKVSSTTSAIADKASSAAASAKDTVASKLGSGGEKPPNNQSSYTEKITSTTSALADKASSAAASAKNTVASKLGYGEKGERDSNLTSRGEEDKKKSESNATSAESPAEYGKKIAVSLTEKLAPVYGKVAGVGSAVKSKVPGSESGSGVVEQDKGVSIKDYLVEKLRPGEEDRALSEVITESLYNKNGEEEEESMDVYEEKGEGRDVRKVVSDAVHKRGGEEEGRGEVRPRRGKVTESEEVRRRLGGWDDEERDGQSSGNGVVDKLKGVVGSWYGNESSQGSGDLSRNSGAEVEQVNNQAVGERRLQESTI